jgi:3-methyladenine DNA glycosylase AlkC
MRDQIDRHIEAGEFEALGPLMDGVDIQSIRYAAHRISTAVDEQEIPEEMDRLLSLRALGSDQLACQLVPYAYSVDKRQALSRLLQLVESEDWTLRDAACEIAGRLLREDFSSMLASLSEWHTRGSSNVFRAMLVAAVRASDATCLERAEPLLKLLEPLLSESDPLVRRNLGPSAIGMHLLAEYPGPTFEYLVKWSTSNDEQTLWNVAMAFSAPAAVPLAKKALIVLRKLSLDERRFVWRAVASAMWKLGRKRPDIIRPELARWLEDERRVSVAREAIKHL